MRAFQEKEEKETKSDLIIVNYLGPWNGGGFKLALKPGRFHMPPHD